MDGAALVLTSSGVGYVISSPEILSPGDEVALHVVTIVKEESLSLFGFSNVTDATIYRRLLKVAGIGPQVGLNLISELGAHKTVVAISSGDQAALVSVSGVGAALAKKIIAGANLPQSLVDAAMASEPEEDLPFADLIDALVALGYEPEEVRSALDGIDPETSDEAAMKAALTSLRGAA